MPTRDGSVTGEQTHQHDEHRPAGTGVDPPEAAGREPGPGPDEQRRRQPGSSGGRPAAAAGPGAAGGAPAPGPPASPHDHPAADAGRAGPDWEDRWRRAAADLENLRRRYGRELERERAAERARVAGAWLPILDNLELALAHAGSDRGAVVAGVQAVRGLAVDVLRRLGYPRHDEVGVPFDPARHEVVSVVDAPDVPPGTVVAVIRPGYGDDGTATGQLRPAAVAVSRQRE
jgi:molecular chaperone GrpE